MLLKTPEYGKCVHVQWNASRHSSLYFSSINVFDTAVIAFNCDLLWRGISFSKNRCSNVKVVLTLLLAENHFLVTIMLEHSKVKVVCKQNSSMPSVLHSPQQWLHSWKPEATAAVFSLLSNQQSHCSWRLQFWAELHRLTFLEVQKVHNNIVNTKQRKCHHCNYLQI